MDVRLVTRIIREIKVALTEREQRSISNAYTYRNDLVYVDGLDQLNFEFSIHSHLFPSWIKKEFFVFPNQVERNVSRFLRELLQSEFHDDEVLSHYCIQHITVRPSRCLEVIWWGDDGTNVLERFGCMFKACLPMYVLLYCVPNMCFDLLLGRKFTFDLCVSRENEGPVVCAPSLNVIERKEVIVDSVP